MLVLLYVVVAVAPTALVAAVLRAARWRRERQAHVVPPVVPARSLEDLVGDLRRLEQDYVRIERSDLPHRATRLTGVRLAYDDALCACCAVLEIDEPARPPLGPVQRLTLEAALARAGVVW